MCLCEECQAKRELWTAAQPPMIEELDEQDGEDIESDETLYQK